MSEPSVQFRALQLANEQRSAYGLRYHDFTRYRKHCANRTHRIRSTLKMTHGKGREFKKLPPLNPDALKEGHLQLLLLEAERAWAYSQELQADALKPANSENASTLRHHATGRFRRSVNWSTQLLSHCQSLFNSSRLPAENLIQVTVYTLILNGRFLRYRDDFEDALIQLSVARSLLDELASAATTSRDQALATLFADEIGPEIRYCAHELGRAKAYDIDGIVQEFSGKHREELVENFPSILQKFKDECAKESSTTGSRTLERLLWEGEPVPVRNPELVDVLLKVQDAQKRLEQQDGAAPSKGSKKGVAAYDAILLALSDAEDVSRKLVEAQQLSGSSSTTASGSRDIQFVNSYIVFQLLSRRIQRDLLLITALPTSSSDQDPRVLPAILKLLSTVIQSLTQMRALSIVDDAPDLASTVEARITFTRARRCLYLSRAYADAKQYGEALILLQHGAVHMRETHSLMNLSSSGSDPSSAYYRLDPSTLATLETSLTEETARFKRDWFAYNGGKTDTDQNLQKPLFFNIAWNYVGLDMEKLQERAGKAPAEALPQETAKVKASVEDQERPVTPEAAPAPSAPRGGITSLLGGWWGRS
ncbi:hypothetical protein C8J56DRAFT_767702 [Mycena floridula]|nr:hypothetical protein C8J56DRAFT_767702 [Mycena floridula]